MKIHSKAAIALLALVMSAPMVLAQDPDPGPGPAQMGPPDGQGPGPQFVYRQRFEARDDGDGNVRWGGGDRGWDRDRGEEMGGHEHPGFMLDRIVSNPEMREKLGISADQAEKIRHQFTAFRIAQVRSQADAEVKRIELHDLLSADNPDKAAIDSKVDEIGAARLAQAKARVDFGLSMRDALTPDQRAKLKELMRKRFSEHGEHDRDGDFRGPHHPHPMGPGEGTPPAPNGQAPANPPAGPGNE